MRPGAPTPNESPLCSLSSTWAWRARPVECQMCELEGSPEDPALGAVVIARPYAAIGYDWELELHEVCAQVAASRLRCLRCRKDTGEPLRLFVLEAGRWPAVGHERCM